MELKELKKEDWSFISALVKRFPNLIEFLGYDDITDWAIDLLRKPMLYLYEDESNAGLICTLKITFSKIMYSDNPTDSHDESLEVLYYALPPNKAAESEYESIISSKFDGKSVKSFNILREEINANPEKITAGSTTSTDTPTTSSDL